MRSALLAPWEPKAAERIARKPTAGSEKLLKKLAAAQAEREIVIAESRKIEEANALIEIAHSELVAAQQDFEGSHRGRDPLGGNMKFQIGKPGKSGLSK